VTGPIAHPVGSADADHWLRVGKRDAEHCGGNAGGPGKSWLPLSGEGSQGSDGRGGVPHRCSILDRRAVGARPAAVDTGVWKLRIGAGVRGLLSGHNQAVEENDVE
jgi:hypothetical protein